MFAGAPQETKFQGHTSSGVMQHHFMIGSFGLNLDSVCTTKPNRNRIPLKDLWTLPLHPLSLVESLLRILLFPVNNMYHRPNLLLHRRQLLPRN